MEFEEELDKNKQKIYYFFGDCEFISTCEADNEKEALREFLQTEKSKDFNLILEFNKKDGSHNIYKNFNQLRKVKSLRHRR